MAWVPTRFHAGNFGTAPNAVNRLFRVAAGKRAVITNISVTPTADIKTFSMYLTSKNAYGGCLAANPTTLANRTQRLWQGFYVVNADEGIDVYTDAPAGTWMTVHGMLGDDTDTMMGGTPIGISPANIDTTGDKGIYTPPSGRTLVVKTMVKTNLSGSILATALRAGGAPIVPYFMEMPPAGNGSTMQVDGTFIVPAGEQVTANIDRASSPGASFYLGGVLL